MIPLLKAPVEMVRHMQSLMQRLKCDFWAVDMKMWLYVHGALPSERVFDYASIRKVMFRSGGSKIQS